jgi:CBS domain containing-hemolysin-like protein
MEVLVIFLLTLLNGFFSLSEIALVSVKASRIQALADQGDGGPGPEPSASSRTNRGHAQLASATSSPAAARRITRSGACGP